MSIAQIEIQIIAALVAVACALPGTFLVLRKMAMLSDAISHAILPGLVLGFFLTHSLNSPLLIVMASLSGILTVVLVELISQSGMVKEDAAIGLVFPALFSIGVLLIAQYADDIHLDTDAVLLGELAFAPFDRLFINGQDWGAKAIWLMSFILLLNLSLILTFFKELKISTFDRSLATSLGFSPAILHYGLMGLTSITTVGAFDAVGAILVVALMVIPAASAYLLYDKLDSILWWAVGFGLFAAIAGYWLAYFLDSSIAGAMVLVLSLLFLSLYLFAPRKGFLSRRIRQKKQQEALELLNFLLSLSEQNHKGQASDFPNKLLTQATQQKLIYQQGKNLALSPEGAKIAQQGQAIILKNNPNTDEEVALPNWLKYLKE